MMVKEKLRLCGQCLDFTTRGQDTSMIYFIEEKQSAEVRSSYFFEVVIFMDNLDFHDNDFTA